MRSLLLQQNEEIILVFHQTALILVGPTLLLLVAVLLPAWYATHYSLWLRIQPFVVLWYFAIFTWWVRKVYLWRVERYVVTTKRFVKVAHEGIFKRVVTETALDRILNISFRTTGAFSVAGGFGNIEIQVVGLLNPIVVENIAAPASVKEFVWQLHEQAVATHGAQTHHMGPEDYTRPNQRMPD